MNAAGEAGLPGDLDAQGQVLWLNAHVELISLRLVRVSSNLIPVDLDGDLDYEMGVTVQGGQPEDDGLVYQVINTICIFNGQRETAFTAELTHVLGYECHFGNIPDEAVQLFGQQTVLLTVAPFVRQEIHHLTQAAGLPPLLLGLYRVSQPRPKSASSRRTVS